MYRGNTVHYFIKQNIHTCNDRSSKRWYNLSPSTSLIIYGGISSLHSVSGHLHIKWELHFETQITLKHFLKYVYLHLFKFHLFQPLDKGQTQNKGKSTVSYGIHCR